ncbi:MAG TPA: hypothetical protein VJ279_01305, partial [Hanamia sp.]|nr:hypothetical protein [Hanamia sp.]
ADSTKHYPLSIETVKKIKAQNKEGIKPEALETAEVISNKIKEVEPEFVDVVGQISLKSLEKNSRKRRDSERRANANPNRPQNKNPQQPQRPSQNKKHGNRPNNPNNNRNRPAK